MVALREREQARVYVYSLRLFLGNVLLVCVLWLCFLALFWLV